MLDFDVVLMFLEILRNDATEKQWRRRVSAATGRSAAGGVENLMPSVERNRMREPGDSQRDAAIGPNSGLHYNLGMRIIALATLKAFVDAKPAHADAREPVMAWYRQVKAADWAGPADVKRDVRSASILKDDRVVFNIAGNKYRIVVWINYPYRVVYIRFIGSHRMYDAIDAQSI